VNAPLKGTPVMGVAVAQSEQGDGGGAHAAVHEIVPVQPNETIDPSEINKNVKLPPELVKVWGKTNPAPVKLPISGDPVLVPS
jgi:hypothetical protein